MAKKGRLALTTAGVSARTRQRARARNALRLAVKKKKKKCTARAYMRELALCLTHGRSTLPFSNSGGKPGKDRPPSPVVRDGQKKPPKKFPKKKVILLATDGRLPAGAGVARFLEAYHGLGSYSGAHGGRVGRHGGRQG